MDRNLATSSVAAPLVIEFAPGSWIRREERLEARAGTAFGAQAPGDDFTAASCIGTYVEFADGSRVSVPTDQVVHSRDQGGSAVIGLGGMTFEGVEPGEKGERLVFFRVRDLLPEEFLDPSRSDKVALMPDQVISVRVQGARVWPRS